ncbi:hypothetical protein Tco_1023032, partial [Tanacetum coccineum]
AAYSFLNLGAAIGMSSWFNKQRKDAKITNVDIVELAEITKAEERVARKGSWGCKKDGRFEAVRDVLSTTGFSQKQWVGIGRIQLDVEDDEDIILVLGNLIDLGFRISL